VASAIAEGSRNRRAGELVGSGVPVEQIPARVGQAAEALATVPLLSDALSRNGVDAPVTARLRELLEGRTSPDDWLESVRTYPSGGRRAA
jgi:glycerol-3-phosphate dehydrogenase (NAD(P)+)